MGPVGSVGEGCCWCFGTGKALGDAGMQVGKVRFCWGQGSWQPQEDTGLEGDGPLQAGLGKSRGPSSPQLAPHQGNVSGQAGDLGRYRTAR